MCICVFQTSSRFSCNNNTDCEKHFGSILANGEHQLWFPDSWHLTHQRRSCFSVTQVQLQESVCHRPTMKPRANVRSRDGVRLSRKTTTCKMCTHRSWKPFACPRHLSVSVTLYRNPMLDVENFTIFIKNSVRFPLFNVTRWVRQARHTHPVSDHKTTPFCLRGNFPSTMTTEQIKHCKYHPEKNPFCPIFRVGDVLDYTGQTIAKLADKV